MSKNTRDKKFFITGGGTGGHIYPAVSVIKELISKGIKNENIFYVGNKKNPECKIAQSNNFQFFSVSVFGMPRKISPLFIKWFFCLIISILKCIFYILKYKPDVVFGTGGYVSAPLLFASRFLKIPYILHDSDYHPGIVTKAFAKGAKAVNFAFEDANKYIKTDNAVYFKNPVRKAFFENTKESARKILNLKDEFVILIMGGSQGAKSINNAALEFIQKFKEQKNIKIILQTGKKNFDEVIKKADKSENVQIEPYFEDMSIPILASDLIVSRAGSISISEILSANVPSILVPYPYAAADHQRKNAKSVSDKNAAIYLEDNELQNGGLIKTIQNILEDKEKYDKLKENSAKLGAGYENSTEKITELLLNAKGDWN